MRDCELTDFIGTEFNRINLFDLIFNLAWFTDMTFQDIERNPKWSFARIDNRGFVQEVREKVAISDIATVGIYMFTHGREFVDFAIDMIVRNDRVNNEFYVCPIYNYAIKAKKKIGIYDMDYENMHGMGTPEDLNRYIEFVCLNHLVIHQQ